MRSSMLSQTSRRESDLGMCKTLFERLAGSNGDYWRRALNRFNRKEDPFRLTEADIWMTIQVGGVGWVKERLTAPRRPEERSSPHVYEFTQWAAALAKPLSLPNTVEDVSFVKGRTAELFGIAESCEPYQLFTLQFLARFNLEPCHQTDVFFLRPNYDDQPAGEYATVWSRAMVDGENRQQLFTLGHHTQMGKLVHVTEMHAGCSEGGAVYIFRMKK